MAAIEERRREQEAELAARFDAMDAGLRRLEELARERGLSEEVAGLVRARNDHRRSLLPRSIGGQKRAQRARGQLRLELIETERQFLYQLLRDGKITDELRRRLERELDLEEETHRLPSRGRRAAVVG